MGQRLDRPASSSITNGPATSSSGNNNNNNNTSAVTNSLSTTFSSSSSSSASSSSSSASVLNQANSARSSSNRHNNYPSNRSHHHNHRSSNRQPRNSIPDQTISVPNNNNNNNTSATSISSVDILNMSPRTRFRHEMARRGYTNSSSDLFFRLFQFPAISSNNSSTASTSTITNSSNTENNNNANSTVTTTNTTAAPAATSSGSSGGGGSGGVSGLSRFFNLGGGSSGHNTSSNQATDDLDSELSSDEDEPHWNHNLNSIARSLPFFFGMRDFKCFVCNKLIPADDVETHIMMCLTKPRLTYNDDVLTDDKGECIICFEILEKGQTIARLPCLCIYHKNCIDSWLARSQSCPGHPN